MVHILLFYWIFCYSIGIANLVFTFLLWRRDRNPYVRIHLVLLSAFTAMVLSLTLLNYGIINHIDGWFYPFSGSLAYASCGFLAFAIFDFANAIAGFKKRKKAAVYFGLFILFLSAGAVIEEFLSFYFYLNIALQGILGLSIIYITSMALFHKNNEAVIKGRMGKLLGIGSAICLPGFLFVDIFYEQFAFIGRIFPKGFYFLPMFYLFWSVLNIRECWYSYFKTFPLENASRNWGLSEREKEVLLLLSQGKTYNIIADELCVSLSTVKTHIERIYKKAGVTGRPELLAKLK